MNNDRKHLIPDLRFPEFVNDAEWKNKGLGEYLDYIQPTNYLVNSTSYDDSYETPVLTAGKTFILGYTDETTGIFAENLPVIIFDDFTTAVQYVDFPFKAKSSAMKILLPKDNASIKFFYESIQNINYFSAAHQRHWISIFSKIEVPVPTNNIEQQKIASCLSSLDELITAQKEKLELLKNHKKGLMQNLFPQEGEMVPKFRFPEFENNGDWEEKILNEVADYENGKAHEQGIVKEGKFIVVNSKFISTEGGKSKQTNHANCPAKQGDILMVLSDLPNGKALGKCFYITTDDKYTVNQRICKITSFDCDSKLLFYIMNRNAYFLSFDDGVKQTNLKNEDVKTFPFLLPKNKIEQEKIASCLSSLDELILSQTEKIEQLQSHKKGLMQGLFPKIID